MQVQFALLAIALIAYAGLSGLLTRFWVSQAMFFMLVGLLLSLTPRVPEVSAEFGRMLATVTLTVVLFADAATVRWSALRTEYGIPVRLLGIGLPLTIVTGALAAVVVLPALSLPEALVLATVLAPTDAALGQAIVTDTRLPSHVRQGLNIESGLNDGICVPFLSIFTAMALGSQESGHGLLPVVEEIGLAVLTGMVAGTGAAYVLRFGQRLGGTDLVWRKLVPAVAALLAYVVADQIGGSGFIAAYVGGMAFGPLTSYEHDLSEFLEDTGSLLGGVTFLLFGWVLLGNELSRFEPRHLLYAVLSLTLIRMIPVSLSLLGIRAKWETHLLLGWFGPRGLASIVFLIVLVSDNLTHFNEIRLVVVATIALSVLAHGLSAQPAAAAYARWFEREGEHHLLAARRQ